MKKIFVIFLSLLLLFSLAFSVCALVPGDKTTLQVVHINTATDQQEYYAYDNFDSALNKAVDGDVIEVFKNVLLTKTAFIDKDITIVSSVKRTAFYTPSNLFVYPSPDAQTMTIKKNFDGTMFNVASDKTVVFKNIILDGTYQDSTVKKGGILLVETGGNVSLGEKSQLVNSILGAEKTFGGAVYLKKGASISISLTEFKNNSAVCGNDIFAEDIASLKGGLPSGISVRSVGDIDFNMKLDVSDCIAVLKSGLTDEQKLLADVNGDGSVDVDDCLEAAEKIVKLK